MSFKEPNPDEWIWQGYFNSMFLSNVVSNTHSCKYCWKEFAFTARNAGYSNQQQPEVDVRKSQMQVNTQTYQRKGVKLHWVLIYFFSYALVCVPLLGLLSGDPH